MRNKSHGELGFIFCNEKVDLDLGLMPIMTLIKVRTLQQRCSVMSIASSLIGSGVTVITQLRARATVMCKVWSTCNNADISLKEQLAYMTCTVGEIGLKCGLVIHTYFFENALEEGRGFCIRNTHP